MNKKQKIMLIRILTAAALLAVAFTGCKNDEYDNKSPFDNVVYLNVSENSDTQAARCSTRTS